MVAKQQPVQRVKPCIFDEDDDLEETTESTNKKSAHYNVNTNMNRIIKKTQIDIEKALNEDPNIFEYDSIYEKVEEEKMKLDPKAHKQAESKEPKYIAGLMKAAARRKMEFEKLQDRKIQKERELEGELWQDKESFVTSAYRQKMEERQKLEEEERRQDEIDSLLDVHKQKNLSGFYSSLLKMKSGEMVIEEESEKERKRLIEKQTEIETKFKSKETHQQKQFRAKNEESDEEEEKEEKEEIKSEGENEIQTTQQEEKLRQESSEPQSKKIKVEQKADETVEEKKEEEPVIKLSKEEQRRIKLENLFKKRTVNEKFDQELAEYFTRKSQHLSLKDYIERE